jgi:CDP-4-dehydro-6-deoxyglucose reductase, E1
MPRVSSKTPHPLRITYAQAVHDDEEKKRVMKVLDEHRTIMGQETREFEAATAKNFGKKFGVMVNSGSSANLLSTELLNLPEGSEVITPVLTFSTTVAPLVQKGLIPVFVDVEPGKYFINVSKIESAITSKTRVLMIPLLFGNVPDMAALKKIAQKHKLILIEDSCDTYGATYRGKPTGMYSDISTTSFYGSHIITAGGGGGMVMINDPKWKDRLVVLRGWGRSSSLFGDTEDIEKRFKQKIGNIQYDAKFIFSERGYNLLPMEIGSAFGNAQLKKLPKFKKIREYNFIRLSKFFKKYEHFFILPIQDKNVSTQWLAYPLTIREGAPFTRLEITKFLEQNNVQTRPLFTGNILRQPGFEKIKHKADKSGYPVADEIMRTGFVIGCHHGMEEKHLARLEELFTQFLKKYN